MSSTASAQNAKTRRFRIAIAVAIFRESRIGSQSQYACHRKAGSHDKAKVALPVASKLTQRRSVEEKVRLCLMGESSFAPIMRRAFFGHSKAVFTGTALEE